MIGPGDLIRVATAPPFANAAGTPTDPTAVSLVWRRGDGAVTTWVYGVDSEVVRDGAGAFHADILVDGPGTYYYRWAGTGAVTAAEEGSFVSVSQFGGGTWSYDLSTGVGQVRLLIDDRDLSNVGEAVRPRKRSAIFSDEEIGVFLDDPRTGGSYTVAAALALIVVAGNRQLLVQSRRIGDTVVDFGHVRADLLKQAAALVGGERQLEILVAPAPADAIVEMGWTDFATDQIIRNAAVREIPVE